MKLRDALDAFVPAWEKLEAKTSREFVVVTALIVAEKQEPKSDLAHGRIAQEEPSSIHRCRRRGVTQHFQNDREGAET